MPNPVKELEEVADLVSIAIAREKTSYKIFDKAYAKSISKNAKRIFLLMMEQDKEHEIQLRSQLKELQSEIALEKARGKKHTI
jgi:rubrerythrin